MSTADYPELDPRSIPFFSRGAVLDLTARILVEDDPPLEALIEGPAGTGKSRGVLELLDQIQWRFPRTRGLICRKTRKSMTESILVTLEEKVFWPGHPALEGPRRDYRRKYEYPNGSEIILAGMDNPQRLFSTEFDWIFVNECCELSEPEFESLFRAMRNGNLPWHFIIADTNPDHEHHWLNKRPERPGSVMERFLSRHTDNPVYFDDWGEPTPEGEEYLKRLGSMSGVLKERMLHGRWVTAEGVIYDCYDPAIHLISPGDPTHEKPWGRHLPDFRFYFASQDWGFTAPGSQQLWGADRDGRIFLLREHYRTEMPTDWWAERLIESHVGWGVRNCVCDPAEPDRIKLFNDTMTTRGRRKIGRIAQKANNERKAGIRLMYDMLNPHQPGGPRMFFVRDSVVERERGLDEVGHPIGVAEEISGYVWAEKIEGRTVKEEPADGLPDHGLDAARYAASYANELNLFGRRARTKYPKGTYGDVLEH